MSQHIAKTDHTGGEDYRTGLGFERVVFFSDAVFAIAITLLVLEIHLPELSFSAGMTEAEKAKELAIATAALPQNVADLSGHFLSYFIGFMVLGLYWINHHRMFAYIKRYDPGLLWANLVFLMFVAFLPFPTSLLGDFGQTDFAVVLYASTVVAAALAYLVMWLYATRNHRLVDPALSDNFIRQYSIRSGLTAIIFLISIPIAIYIDANIAKYFWMTLLFSRQLARPFSRST